MNFNVLGKTPYLLKMHVRDREKTINHVQCKKSTVLQPLAPKLPLLANEVKSGGNDVVTCC